MKSSNTRPNWAKKNAPLLAALALLFKGGMTYANPQGGQVTAGSATIDQSNASTTTVTQQSDRAVINWQSFSIGEGETTRFVQPSASSVTLNRVTGGDPSQILGSLSANGNLFIINRNGVIFGTNARVDVGGLVITTHDIDDNAFMAGDYRFTTPGRADASIVNLGQITISDAGLAAFVAPAVRNDGVIVAHLGRIALASSNGFTLDLYGDKLIQLSVDPITLRAIYPDGTPVSSLVENNGTIAAEGGTVLLTASAARDVVNNVINVTGLVSATSARVDGGNIILEGGNGNVQVTGTLDASSSAGNGGTIAINGNASLVSGDAQLLATSASRNGGTLHLLGDRVGISGNSRLDTSGATGGGTVLVGGDYHGDSSTMRNATFTYFGANAQINADALQSGNGGKVVLWSNDTTHMLGTISARGGALSGHGGFVETSGKGYLDFLGSVDTTAANGTKGTLLLDPTNIIVGATADIAGNNTGADLVTVADLATATNYGPVTSNIKATTLANLLAANSVTLAASNNIAINSAVNVTFISVAQTLTLNAQTININANIASTNGAMNLALQATGGTTLNNAALALTGGILTTTGLLSATNGTLENVMLGSNLTLGSNSTLNINNSLNLGMGATFDIGNSTVNLNGTAGIVADPQGSNATVAMSGGKLNSAGTANAIGVAFGGTVTVQGFGTLSGNQWDNSGTISANSANQTLAISSTNFNNTGTLQATNGTLAVTPANLIHTGSATASGGTLNIAPVNAWSNQGALTVLSTGTLNTAGNWSDVGMLTVSGGTMNLGGNFTLAGSLLHDGGQLNITGTLDLGNTTLDLTTAFGGLGLSALAGTIKNGTLVVAPTNGVFVSVGSPAVVNSSGGTLDNITIGSALTFQGDLNVSNGLTLASAATFNNLTLSNGATLKTGTNTATINGGSLAGSGTVNLGGGKLTAGNTMGTTIGSGVIVSGNGALTGTSWINNGTIDANGQTIALASNSLSNNGTLLARNGGTLALTPINTFVNTGLLDIASSSTLSTGGNFTNAASGVIQGFGTLDLGGANFLLDNQGLLSPGGSGTTGALTLNGSLSMAQGSTLLADITGPDGYDTLIVKGAANLGGTLDTKVGYQSADAATFTLITAGNVSGTFASVAKPDGFTAEYRATTFSMKRAAADVPHETYDSTRYSTSDEFGGYGEKSWRELSIQTQENGSDSGLRDNDLSGGESTASPSFEGSLTDVLGSLKNYSAEERAAFYNTLSAEQVTSALTAAGHMEMATFLSDTASGTATTTRQFHQHLAQSNIPPEQRSEWLGVFARMRHIGMGHQLSSALNTLRDSPDSADELDDGVAGGPIRISTAPTVESRDGQVTVSGRVHSGSKMIQLRLNGRWVHVDEEGHFTATVPLAQGTHTLMLEAKDPAGVGSTTSIRAMSGANAMPQTEKRKRVALIIGVEEYDNAIPELETPLSDARDLRTALESRYGFESTLLANPTKRQVLDALTRLSTELSEQDQLLVYYAGHGFLVRETGRGYWLPRDAQTSNPRNWISNRDVARLFHKTKAKQILLISDSCYSGTFTREGAGAEFGKEASRNQRAVMAFSSGGEQPVWDGGGGRHSLFAAHLLAKLESGKAKTGQDLYRSIRSEVVKVSPQVPGYGAMVSAGYDFGADYALK